MASIRLRGISFRLAASFGLVLVLLLAIAGLSVLQLQRLQRQADELVSQHIGVLDLIGRMQQNVGERSVLLRDLVLNDNLSAQRALTQRLRANGEQHAGLARRLDALAQGEGGGNGTREMLARITEQAGRTAKVENEVMQDVADARFDDAKQKLADALTPQHQALNAQLREAFVATMNGANRSVEQNRARNQTVLVLELACTALAVLLGAAVAFVTARGIARPLAQAHGATQRVAAGDLTKPIAVAGRDELAQLLAALEQMRQALTQSVTGIRIAAQSVRSGAERIEQGSGDLAARTEEQAASLEESASSMEEFTATVQQNAQSAGEASALARETTEVAVRGGEAVRGVVATMQGIHGASARIGDIIGVIDGIAFQTNILALNAAVEAARAGEQGRGFAVVAGEVRTLAQRSAGAAKEIKTLIQDASRRVGDGVQQVEAAGRTMDEIVASVRKVTNLVVEIAHASAEQLSGIEQVNRALAQMDGNTQRNASLVQETADAAQQMTHQAVRLVEAVARFQLPGDGAAAARTRTQRGAADPELLSLPAPLGAS
jgi:methyl-accepting chemotaxis protein